jgi:hypothetical protein
MRNGPKSKNWYRLKKNIENLFDPSMDMRIDCSIYHETEFTITVRGEVIWRFPGIYSTDQAPRKAVPWWDLWWDTSYAMIFDILRVYRDQPRAELFGAIETGWHRYDDGNYWDLFDILRAADRRISKPALLVWMFQLDGGPAMSVLAERFRDK